MEVLAFEVDGQRYGLPASVVREIVRVVAITPLPRSSGGGEGVVDVRGEPVEILDLRSRLGLPPAPVDPEQHLIFASVGGRLIGLRVDRAVGLVDLESEGTPSKTVPGLSVVPDSEKPLLLLADAARFLGPEAA